MEVYTLEDYFYKDERIIWEGGPDEETFKSRNDFLFYFSSCSITILVLSLMTLALLFLGLYLLGVILIVYFGYCIYSLMRTIYYKVIHPEKALENVRYVITDRGLYVSSDIRKLNYRKYLFNKIEKIDIEKDSNNEKTDTATIKIKYKLPEKEYTYIKLEDLSNYESIKRLIEDGKTNYIDD